MKRQRLLILFVFFMVLPYTGIGVLAATEVPEKVIIDHDVYKSDRKGPVPFSHQSHAEDYMVECNQCHHVYKDGKNVWKEGDPVDKCVTCHDPSKSQGKIKKLNLAFHTNCQGCHRKMAKEGGTDNAPYRKCYECHKKKP